MGAQLLPRSLGWTVTTPLHMRLQPPAAARPGWRVQGPPAHGKEVGGWPWAAAPGQGCRPGVLLQPRARDTGSRAGEVPWDGAVGRCRGTPGAGPFLHQPLVLFTRGVLLVGLLCRNPTHTGECPRSAEAAELGGFAEGPVVLKFRVFQNLQNKSWEKYKFTCRCLIQSTYWNF